MSEVHPLLQITASLFAVYGAAASAADIVHRLIERRRFPTVKNPIERSALIKPSDICCEIDALPPFGALAVISTVEHVMKDKRADAVDRIPDEALR